jgi:hypothetical protein
MANNLLFSYKLLNNDTNKTENTDGLFVSSWGSATEQGRKYWLEISAQADASWSDSSSLDLQSIDLTLTFDNKLFRRVFGGELQIDSRLPLFRSAMLGDYQTTDDGFLLQNSVRFAAGSASDLGSSGAGISLSKTTSTTIARLLVDVNDAYFRTNTLNAADDVAKEFALRDEASATPTPLKLDQLLSFTVNRDETVFGDLKTLRDNGGVGLETANTSVNVLRATQLVDIRGATFNTYEPLGTQLNYGAASGQKTNLVRAKSSLTRTFDIANVGSSSLQDLQLTKQGTTTQATATLKASKLARQSNGTLAGVGSAVEVSTSTKLSETLSNNSLGLIRNAATGAIDTVLQAQANTDGNGNVLSTNNSGDVLRVELNVTAADAAGSVLELNDTGGFIMAADGFTKTFTGLNTKNLITYQGDLNYDGKVSFQDLAFLNAGAAEYNKGVGGKSIADVDANFDEEINIEDLAILENDWGKSLHTSIGTFTGSTGFGSTSNEWKVNMSTFNGSSAWSNSAFEAENAMVSMPALDRPTSGATITGGVNNDDLATDATSLATIPNI